MVDLNNAAAAGCRNELGGFLDGFQPSIFGLLLASRPSGHVDRGARCAQLDRDAPAGAARLRLRPGRPFLQVTSTAPKTRGSPVSKDVEQTTEWISNIKPPDTPRLANRAIFDRQSSGQDALIDFFEVVHLYGKIGHRRSGPAFRGHAKLRRDTPF